MENDECARRLRYPALRRTARPILPHRKQGNHTPSRDDDELVNALWLDADISQLTLTVFVS